MQWKLKCRYSNSNNYKRPKYCNDWSNLFTVNKSKSHFLTKDNKSHIFRHLHSIATCFVSYSSLSFTIIDEANSKFDLKIKEALHINWRKPNVQQKSFSSHPFIITSAPFFFSIFVLCVCVYVCVCVFLFHLLCSLSLR